MEKRILKLLRKIREIFFMIISPLSYFQIFILVALSYIFWGPYLLPTHIQHVDGETIYTSGFLIIFYLVYVELFSKLDDDMSNPVVTGPKMASFWLKYKDIESNLILLFRSKIVLLRRILVTFSLIAILVKSRRLLRAKNLVYKVTLQTLSRLRLRLKNKSLPLQQN